MPSPYANTGLSPEEIADLDACDAAHAAWWDREHGLGWRAGQAAFALRIAFNAGWYFCSERAASRMEAQRGETENTGSTAEGGDSLTAESGDAQTPSPSSRERK